MSDEGKRYSDPEIERFFSENKEMIERLLREEKEIFISTFEQEKEKVGELMDEQKDKAKEMAQGVVNMVTDPEVQRHFMAVGMELLMGMNALMRAAPVPDTVKDMMDKAEEMRKTTADNFCKTNPDCNKKPKPAAPEKIDIKPVAKKPQTSSAKPKSDTKPKTSG